MMAAGKSWLRPSSDFEKTSNAAARTWGGPIEVLNSLTLLAEARVNLIRALVHYDQAQFNLWVSSARRLRSRRL